MKILTITLMMVLKFWSGSQAMADNCVKTYTNEYKLSQEVAEALCHGPFSVTTRLSPNHQAEDIDRATRCLRNQDLIAHKSAEDKIKDCDDQVLEIIDREANEELDRALAQCNRRMRIWKPLEYQYSSIGCNNNDIECFCEYYNGRHAHFRSVNQPHY